MTGERAKLNEKSETTPTRRNERSAIEFPYLDLETAISVAVALYQRAGLGSCEIDELAAEMRQTVSGAFRLKTATTKVFALVEKDGRSGFRLSSLGQQVVNTETEAKARAEAFMAVPLYAQLYEKYKGHLLPPAKALEREMAALGVAPKQTDKARQVFERSARQAGFNAQGDDRLVQPRFDRQSARVTEPLTLSQSSSTGNASLGGNGGQGSSEKPLRYQLIDLLDPEAMTSEEQQAVWTLINYLARDKAPSHQDKGKAASENIL